MQPCPPRGSSYPDTYSIWYSRGGRRWLEVIARRFAPRFKVTRSKVIAATSSTQALPFYPF